MVMCIKLYVLVISAFSVLIKLFGIYYIVGKHLLNEGIPLYQSVGNGIILNETRLVMLHAFRKHIHIHQ